MKIKIDENATRHGFTEEEARRIISGIDKRMIDRWVSTKMLIFIEEFANEVTIQIAGDTPKNSPQEFELRLSLGMIEDMVSDRDRVVQTIGECAVSCMRRDLDWLESGRCLGTPSTKQLDEAREFLIPHLREIEEEWIVAQDGKVTTEATPVPLHIHLSNVIAGLTPAQVEDAHRERAKELREKMVAGSPVGPGDAYPEDYALDMMAQAIADAESRGEQKGREA